MLISVSFSKSDTEPFQDASDMTRNVIDTDRSDESPKFFKSTKHGYNLACIDSNCTVTLSQDI